MSDASVVAARVKVDGESSKRKRGGPPKHNPDDDATVGDAGPGEKCGENVPVLAAAAVRRTSGRPRKHPTEQPAAAVAAAVASSSKETSSPKPSQGEVEIRRSSRARKQARVTNDSDADEEEGEDEEAVLPQGATVALKKIKSTKQQRLPLPPAQPEVDVRNSAAWHPFRAQLAAFIDDVVANRDGGLDVARFCRAEAVRTEYQSTLSSLGAIGQFATFVFETAVAKDEQAYARFAARFDPPWHRSAHPDFLCPLVYARLCALVRLRSVSGGAAAPLVLSCNLLAEIEAHQRERQEAAKMKRERQQGKR